jgi:hypothetical protein
VAIVGAGSNDSAGENTGAAYFFDVATGQEFRKLNDPDRVESGLYASRVVANGDSVLLSAFALANPVPHVNVVELTTGAHRPRLVPSDSAANDHFGEAVAINNSTAIIGAHFNSHAGTRSGSAYLFNVNTSQELFQLKASDAAAGDFFGEDVDISGNYAIVGAPENDDSGEASGAAYLFNVATGQQLLKLTASDAAASSRFGADVAISGNTAMVTGGGSAYLFDVATGHELMKLSFPAPLIVTQVAMNGNTAILNAITPGSIPLGRVFVIDVTRVPEPATLASLGLAAVLPLRVRRNRSAQRVVGRIPTWPPAGF